MRFWLNFPLRDQAGDGDGSGSGALTLEAVTKLITDTVNGLDKRYKKEFEALKKPATQKQEGEGDEGNSGEGGAPPPKPGGVDPEVLKLRKQLEQTNKRLADADAERAAEKAKNLADKKDTAIRRELAKISFIDDEAFESAYARLERDIKFAEDGQLVGGEEDVPLSKFVPERMKRLDFLVKPREVGGGGVANGGKQQGGADVDIDNIRPGMKPDEKAKIYAAIQALKPK